MVAEQREDSLGARRRDRRPLQAEDRIHGHALPLHLGAPGSEADFARLQKEMKTKGRAATGAVHALQRLGRTMACLYHHTRAATALRAGRNFVARPRRRHRCETEHDRESKSDGNDERRVKARAKERAHDRINRPLGADGPTSGWREFAIARRFWRAPSTRRFQNPPPVREMSPYSESSAWSRPRFHPAG